MEKSMWDEYHKKKSHLSKKDKYIDELVDLFHRFKIKRILDLACGNGVHVVFLAERNLEVYGFDFSNEAIKLTRTILNEKNLNADLRVHSMFDIFPFDNDFFDAVICTKALHQN